MEISIEAFSALFGFGLVFALTGLNIIVDLVSEVISKKFLEKYGLIVKLVFAIILVALGLYIMNGAFEFIRG